MERSAPENKIAASFGRGAAVLLVLVVIFGAVLGTWKLTTALARARARELERQSRHEKAMSLYEFDSIASDWFAKCNRFRADGKLHKIDGWTDGGSFSRGEWVDYVLDIQPAIPDSQDKPCRVTLDVTLFQDGRTLTQAHHEQAIDKLSENWRITLPDFIDANKLKLQPGKYSFRLAITVNGNRFEYSAGELSVVIRRPR